MLALTLNMGVASRPVQGLKFCQRLFDGGFGGRSVGTVEHIFLQHLSRYWVSERDLPCFVSNTLPSISEN